ncbi:hypothetical protein GCM10008955_14760 [Deinococcus malanensis]|uniref:Uncharacterized protein n=1 Tax=Deinococcus malanensis TaxID=1706855 RepID=A0ABQ2EV76_9DEIO|nr:hypothetical protein GCM10008955_14760 [Deinococcus malanensis]
MTLNRQLQAAQAKWAAAGLRNYTYDLRQLAAPVLFPEVRITVRNSRRTSLKPVQGDVMVALPMTAGPMEERFATVRQTLRAQQQTRCPDLKLRFDPALGYPTLVYSGTAEANVADGYGEWSIRRLLPLP